ncbi:hypothetical protein UYSO10_1474 [Kosakonia radicincitans]|nr:hypothetical protein UYSO10_1474 [Kosakonia radicincitans]
MARFCELPSTKNATLCKSDKSAGSHYHKIIFTPRPPIHPLTQ